MYFGAIRGITILFVYGFTLSLCYQQTDGVLQSRDKTND